MTVEPLDAPFGAVVRGVEIRALDDSTFDAIRDAWVEHGLLVFPAQHLTRAEQDGFARRFGDLEFEATPLTNIRRDGSLRSDPDNPLVQSLRGNEGWHHDSTYMPVQAKGAVFTAEVVPTDGGDTGFADMRAAYDALDDSTRATIAECIRSPRLARETFGQVSSDEDKLEQWIRQAAADKRLKAPDPALAAEHFWALVKFPVFFPLLLGLAEAPSERQAKKIVREGVRVFLGHYGAEG